MARGVAPVPEWARAGTVCASCRRARGNVTRQGWQRIIGAEGATTGWTCGDCPRWDEPIRRSEVRGIPRFKAFLDATPPGATPRRYTSRVCSTLSEARAFVAEVRTATEAGKVYGEVQPVEVEVARLTESVDQLAQRWLDTYQGVRLNTIDGYRQWIGYSRRRFGDRAVVDLAVGDVRGLVAWMHKEGGRRGQGLSNTTIADAIKALALILDLAEEEGTVPSNVARAKSIKLPRESRVQAADDALDYWPTTGVADAATVPLMAKFLATSDLDPLAAAWRLSCVGITRSEVLGLSWDDVDLDTGDVSIRRGRTPLDKGGDRIDDPKSDARYRTLPVEELSPGTLRLLRALRSKQREDRMRAGEAWEDTGFVVVDELGRPVKPRTYSDRWSRLCTTSKVPRIKLHNARASLAQLMIERRIPLDVCAAILGHTLAVFLAKYVRQSPRDRIREHAQAFVHAA